MQRCRTESKGAGESHVLLCVPLLSVHRRHWCALLCPASKSVASLAQQSHANKSNVQTSTSAPPGLFCTNSLLDYGEEDEAYLYLDPKLRERADPAAARSRGPPREVIVFMVGGGCYSEYQNLQVRGEQS